MASCCLLPMGTGLHRPEHTSELNFAERGFIAGSFDCLKFPSMPETGALIPNEDHKHALVSISNSMQAMSQKREISSFESGVDKVTSASFRSSKEDDCDMSSSSDNRDVRHLQTAIGRRDSQQAQFSGVSRKRGRTGDMDRISTEEEKDSMKEWQRSRHKTLIPSSDINLGTRTKPMVPAFALGKDVNGSHHGSLFHSKEDHAWPRYSGSSAAIPLLTPVLLQDPEKDKFPFEQRGGKQKDVKEERDFLLQRPVDRTLYVGSSESKLIDAPITREPTTNEIQSIGLIPLFRGNSKRMLPHNIEFGVSGSGSVSTTVHETTSENMNNICRGNKDTSHDRETLRREQENSKGWKWEHSDQQAASGSFLGFHPSIYQPGSIFVSQDNVNTGVYARAVGTVPLVIGQAHPSSTYLTDDPNSLKPSMEISNLPPCRGIQLRSTDPVLMQKSSRETKAMEAIRDIPYLPQSSSFTSTLSLPLDRSGLHVANPQDFNRVLQRPLLQVNDSLATSSSAPIIIGHAIGHGVSQSSLASTSSFPSQFIVSMPPQGPNFTRYPPSLSRQQYPPVLPRALYQEAQTSHQYVSEGLENVGLLLNKPFDLEKSPSVTVIMEGRSIGRSLCLHNFNCYESFSKALREMFESNISEDDPPGHEEVQCNLENAIPGHIIAYEDSEGDLLLAGDLTWKDFVRVAKRIRIMPSKICKAKGKC